MIDTVMSRRLLFFVMSAACCWAQAPRQDITINYPARAPSNWPLFIAKEGGYFEKYGLNGKLVFGVHPAGIAMLVSGEAAMTNYTLEQAMQAASKDGSLVAVGSGYKKGLWALMVSKALAAKDVGSARDLKGKRVGVSQIGDAPYNYTVALLAKFGITQRDVQWVPLGTDVNGRAAALTSGRVDATLLDIARLLQAGGCRLSQPRQPDRFRRYLRAHRLPVQEIRAGRESPARGDADQGPGRSHQALLRR